MSKYLSAGQEQIEKNKKYNSSTHSSIYLSNIKYLLEHLLEYLLELCLVLTRPPGRLTSLLGRLSDGESSTSQEQIENYSFDFLINLSMTHLLNKIGIILKV